MRHSIVITFSVALFLLVPQQALGLSCLAPDFFDISTKSESVVQARILDIVSKDISATTTSPFGQEGYYKLEIQKSWIQDMPSQIDLHFNMWTNYLKKDEVYLINLNQDISTGNYNLEGCEELISSKSAKFIPMVNVLNSNFVESNIAPTLYNSDLLIRGYILLLFIIFLTTFIVLHKKVQTSRDK